MRGFVLSFVTALVVSCAPSPSPNLGSSTSDITDGTRDKVDASVVLIVIDQPPSTATWSGCTGTVVSPHVVLTAAHCISSSPIEKGYRYRLFFGDDLYVASEKNNLANWGPAVVEAHAHPDFAVSASTVVNDVGVLITKDPLALAPVPLRRAPLGPDAVGQDVRIVGFGEEEAGVDTVYRATATTKIATLQDKTFDLMGAPATCEGDSGGPSFVTENGVESIAGVHSGGSLNCAGTSIEMRVDAYASFIDSFIASAEGVALEGGADATAPAAMDATDGGASANDASPAGASGCSTARGGERGPDLLALLFMLGVAMRARRRLVR